MNVHPPPAPPPVRVARDPLVAVTCVAVLLAVAGYAYETVRQNVAAAAALASEGLHAGSLEEHSYTNASSAHITLTNLNAFNTDACLKGVVSQKGSDQKTESAPVCTGVMKPRTTVTLEAPYPVGDVDRICDGEPDRFGNQHIDWGRCRFTTVPVGSTLGR